MIKEELQCGKGRTKRRALVLGKEARMCLLPKRFDRVERKTIENRRRRRRFASAEVFSSLSHALSSTHPSPLPPKPCHQLQNPLTSGSPLETLKKKSDAAFTWVQNEQAEVANTAYRLKTIYQQNKTVPRKYLTCESSFFLFFQRLKRERRKEERERRSKRALTHTHTKNE